MQTNLTLKRRRFLGVAAAGAGVMATGLSACGGGEEDAVATDSRLSPQAARPPTVRDVPILACSLNKTATSLGLVVTAGATGAVAGFSLQWMRAGDLATRWGIWPSDESLLCTGGFSGKANLSRYDLVPGESVEIQIGNLLLDSGASTTCAQPLACGMEYAFRVFAHGDNLLRSSDWSTTHTCATAGCVLDVCTYTQGYWKTHGPVPVGTNEYLWPTSVKSEGLLLGTVRYTPLQLLDIFNTPVAGNGLLALAHQLIAVKLNLANGADPTTVASAVAAADTLIGSLVAPPVGSGALAAGAFGALVQELADYNEGNTGPGHCG